MCADNLNINWICRNSSGHIRVTTVLLFVLVLSLLGLIICELKNTKNGTQICSRSDFRSENKIKYPSLQHIVHDPLAQYLVTTPKMCFHIHHAEGTGSFFHIDHNSSGDMACTCSLYIKPRHVLMGS